MDGYEVSISEQPRQRYTGLYCARGVVLMVVANLERSYKGYRICGDAESIYGKSGQWYSIATVILLTPKQSVTQVFRYEDREITGDDEQLVAWFGLALAEIAVDHLVLPPAYYHTPMNAA